MEYVYMRVSTNNQDNNNQRSRVKKLYPEATFIEEACSSGRTRPLLEELIDKLQPGDKVIVLRIDRLSRNAIEFHGMMGAITKKGAVFISIEQPSVGNDDDIQSQLMTAILPIMAQNEKTLISGRTSDAWKAREEKLTAIGQTINMPHNYHIAMSRKTVNPQGYLDSLPAKSGYIKARGNRGTGGCTPTFRPQAMIDAVMSLRAKGHSWTTVTDKLCRMQPADTRYSWKVSEKTAKRIHFKEEIRLKRF